MAEITDSLVCTECGVEFLPAEGGICHRCTRLFCGEDLFVEEDETSRVCRACRPPDSKTRPVLAEYQAASLRARRRARRRLR